tara:strand:+ start:106 stop:1131 length:1026 start_codon:yes stop_codon:yes gene_type:complete
MSNNTVISLDLAKSVIQVAKLSRHGEILFNKAQSPDKVRQLIANTPACVVAMEGCGSAQYWARFARQCGHEARIISPRLVKPFIKGQKNDANDALGVAIAAIQPHMTFAPVKSLEQHTIQAINTSRRFLDKSLTALGNHVRALAYEFGCTVPKGKSRLKTRVAEILAPENDYLPEALKTLLETLWEQYLTTEAALKVVTKQLEQFTTQIDACQRLQDIEGIGPKSASLLYAAMGNGNAFKNGRAAAVYAGVTPKQHSSGGKTVLLGITKHGDSSLRATLYQGALSVISQLKPHATTIKERWLIDLVHRVGTKRACIALVNKNIRTAWALLKNNTQYQPVYL